MLSRSTIIGKIKALASLPTKYLIKYSTTHVSYDTNFAKVPNEAEILSNWSYPLRMPNGLVHFFNFTNNSNIIYNPITKTYISLSATTEYPSARCSRPCFNADGTQIFVVRYYGDSDIRIAIYSTSNFSLVNEYTTPFYTTSGVALSSSVIAMYNLGNNQLLIIGGSGKYIYNYITQAYTSITVTPTGDNINPSGTLWATGQTASPYLRRYSMPDATLLSALATMPTGAVRDVAFSPNGSLFACVQSTGATRRLLVYNTSDWSRITTTPTLTTYAMYSCMFSADSQYLFIVTNSSTEGLLVYRTSDWSKVTIAQNFAGSSYSMDLRPATII